jgi:general secretion pathway protein G
MHSNRHITKTRGTDTPVCAFPRRRIAAAQFGFTLLEIMIVISIILILATLGAARYHNTVIRAREAVLAQDLKDMRKAIWDYTQDKGCSPTSLDDLVSAGYLREIPVDPFTKQKDWVTSNSDLLVDPDQTCTGISDVNSSSNNVSPFENTPYSTW